MSAKQKRTYNLAPDTVRAVRELADEYHAAPTQDGVIELAVDELRRRLRETTEAGIWEAAAADADFIGEVDEAEKAYGSADRETWPA
jgi:Flp pilus assembly protein TadD